MRIGLITTLGTNIGDDFIREGIYHILRCVFESSPIEFVPVNKHRPMTVYPLGHPCRWAEYIPYGKRFAFTLFGKIFHNPGQTLFDDCDLIVQCGAPVLWPGCHKAEWADPLWHQVIGPIHDRIPVLNLAAGSSYPWERQPSRISDPRDARYLKAILKYCRLTTSRDSLAQSLFSSLGGQTAKIPCSALLAARHHKKTEARRNLILINYMEGGGHYDWNQDIEKTSWRETMRTLIDRMRKRHRIAFLCHNRKEYESAKRVNSSIERFLPTTPMEYFRFASNAKAAICNRMHASVGLAGMGIPSVAVGTDTRILMVKALELPCYYVKDANADLLERDLEHLLEHRDKQEERLLSLQSDTFESYVDIVRRAL